MKIIKALLIQVETVPAYSLNKNWAGKILLIIRASNTKQKNKACIDLYILFPADYFNIAFCVCQHDFNK